MTFIVSEHIDIVILRVRNLHQRLAEVLKFENPNQCLLEVILNYSGNWILLGDGIDIC